MTDMQTRLAALGAYWQREDQTPVHPTLAQWQQRAEDELEYPVDQGIPPQDPGGVSRSESHAALSSQRQSIWGQPLYPNEVLGGLSAGGLFAHG